jgi:hypothetical protein
VDDCPTVANADQIDSDGGDGTYMVTRLPDTPIVDPDTLDGSRSLIVCDGCTTTVSFGGRRFPLYGTTQGSVVVSDDAYLEFPSGWTVGIEQDLDPTDPASYRANLLEDRFVLTWRDVPYYGGTGHLTFQFTLFFNSGDIEWNFDDLIDSSYGRVGIAPGYLADTGIDFAGMAIGSSIRSSEFAPIGRTYFLLGELSHSRFRFSSGDGLGDACDPCPADRGNDPDGDGVCAHLDPCPDDATNTDPDGDLVCADADNCPTVANADQTDNDGDGVGTVCDPCPVDPANDAEHDGVCADVDNCPTVLNPNQGDAEGDGVGDACDNCASISNSAQENADADAFGNACDNCDLDVNGDQTDGDLDGVGDACDTCPSMSNPLQQEPVACVAVGAGNGECRVAQIEVVEPAFDGEIRLSSVTATSPQTMTFFILATSCVSSEMLEISLNGTVIGSIQLDPAVRCTCSPAVQTLQVNDSALLASAWRAGLENSIRLHKSSGSALAWVSARFEAEHTTESDCLFDANGGTCTLLDLCAAGFSSSPLDESRITTAELVVQETPINSTPIVGGNLPAEIDLATCPDGPARLCVGSTGSAVQDCVSFAKAGEAALAINGSPCRPPTAVAATDAVVECTSPEGAAVVLDGSGSSDPSSTPGTRDGIVSYLWLEALSAGGEATLGTGETLSPTLPLGVHTITLRVTDALGQTDEDTVVVTIRDTTPPVLSLSLSEAVLWPPNHRMIDVITSLTASDVCSTPTVVLASVTSNEPDDGVSDGTTTGDIQGVSAGTTDGSFSLRAERRGDGTGRIYSVRYSATDVAGNESVATNYVFVPHTQGGVVDPIRIALSRTTAGTRVSWAPVAGALHYNVIRGNLADVLRAPSFINLGAVTCIEAVSPDTSTAGREDAALPAPGNAFFYLVEFNDGQASSYGSESAGAPQVPASGACQRLIEAE